MCAQCSPCSRGKDGKWSSPEAWKRGRSKITKSGFSRISKPRPNCFFAYDPGDPFETLQAARRLVSSESRYTACSHRLRCYVLISGYPKDSFALADARLKQMLSIDLRLTRCSGNPRAAAAEKHRPAPEWKQFQRLGG